MYLLQIQIFAVIVKHVIQAIATSIARVLLRKFIYYKKLLGKKPIFIVILTELNFEGCLLSVRPFFKLIFSEGQKRSFSTVTVLLC